MTDNSSLDAAGETPLVAPSRSTRLLAVGVLLVVALAGLIGGIALDRTLLPQRQWEGRGGGAHSGPRQQGPRRPSAMLGVDLKLTEEQAVRIDSLMERQIRGFREIRQSTQPAIDSLMAQTRRSMDSIITPGQRALLDSARARREAGLKKRYPNGTPPRGGPGDWGRVTPRQP